MTGWRRLLRDIVVAFAALGLVICARLVIEHYVSDIVPFTLTFPVIIAAGLLAGARAGILTIAGCQMLVWYFVIPPSRSFAIESSGQVVSLLLSTSAQCITVWAVTAYRRAALRLREENQHRVEILSIALKEIDHRTKNNFHVAASLLTSQAATADDPRVADELRLAASRLMSIASTYKNLALSSATLSSVLLHDHLREICDQLRDGMLPPTVTLTFTSDPVTVTAEVAVSAGLIVNEWITNAAKHAFPDAIGTISVSVTRLTDGVEIVVADDGTGVQRPDVKGRGANLTTLLARSIRARSEIAQRDGTCCTLRLAAG
ncbi:MAG: Two-component sensor histidine kinase, contains HisKA and HATPase domain [Rhizorhabdus sp.]|nr:Two-component sensor histidine kinase, contains HisKA and HATPase domain [Rhizorhabdus sp.]